MKKLHLIGFTPDDDGLILTARKGSKSGGYVVPIDDALVASIERARRRRAGEDPDDTYQAGAEGAPRGGGPARPRSSLSPREIQARLRAGSTITEVARQAGVDDEWVARFAAPILAEQAQVVERAQRLILVKARRGPSIESLAPSVQWNLSDRGVRFSDDVFADSWTAFNLHGARWAVRFAYTSRKRRKIAEWEVDLRERSLVARNRLATDLGHVEEGRRRPTLDPPDAGAEEPAASGATGRAMPRGRAATSASATRAATPARPAGRGRTTAGVLGARRGPARGASGAAAKAAPTSGTATKAAGAQAPAKKVAAAKKAAVKKAAAKKVAGRKMAGTKVAASKAAATKAAGTKVGVSKAAGRVGKAAGRNVGGPVGKAAATRAGARPAKRGVGVSPKPAAKRAGRESLSQKARPAKKAAGDTPGAPGPGRRPSAPVVESASDRPSHLGRPPSPMKMANRATSYPSQRLTETHARQGPPPSAERAAATVRGSSMPGAPSSPGNPRFEPGPAPERPKAGRSEPTGQRGASERLPTTAGAHQAPAPGSRPAAPAPEPARAAGPAQATTGGRPAATAARPAAAAAPAPPATGERAPVAPPIGRRPVATRPGAPAGDEDRPAVVILSTPAPGLPGGSSPEEDERRARLASAERLRAALGGAAASTGASSPRAGAAGDPPAAERGTAR